MKKNISILMFSLMATCIILTSTYTVDAANFSDLDGHKWAVKYINDMTDKGIFSGYPDGTFKPGNPVTRIESLVMISNLYPKSEIDKIYNENKNSYEKRFEKFSIDKWARPYVLFSIKKGVIPDTDQMLQTLVNKTTKKPINATRFEVAVFVARGLGFQDEMDKNAKLNFKDNNDIPEPAIKFIDILIKKGILSNKGDGSFNFRPDKIITRAEIATILSNSYKYSAKNKENSSDKNQDTTTQTFTLEGEISLITYLNNNMTISLRKSNGETSNYTNKTENIVIYKGDSPVNFSELRVGSKAKLVFENGLMKKIILPQDETRVSGVLKAISLKEKTLDIQIDNNKIEKYSFTDDTSFIINDETKSAKDLRENSDIDVYFVNNKMTKIIAEITKYKIDGEITKINGNEITFKSKDDGDVVASLTNDSKIYVGIDIIKDTSFIQKGNKVIANIENGKIIELELAREKASFPYSRLDGILYTQKSTMIQFTDYDGISRKYNVNRDTVIRIDNVKSDIRDLKLGYDIDIYTDGIDAVEIISTGKLLKSTITGRVRFIDLADKKIEMKAEDGKTYSLSYNLETKIEDLDGKPLKPRDILNDDKITAIGVMNGGILEADRLIVNFR